MVPSTQAELHRAVSSPVTIALGSHLPRLVISSLLVMVKLLLNFGHTQGRTDVCGQAGGSGLHHVDQQQLADVYVELSASVR